MMRREKGPREQRHKHGGTNPSFSSTLLDEIYRSIDCGDKRSGETRFGGERRAKSSLRAIEEEEMDAIRRACFIEKWMDKKLGDSGRGKERHYLRDSGRKSLNCLRDHDQDALFFSSTTSSSSDSSSGGFSSSDTESMFGTLSLKPSSFAPLRPMPIRTSSACRPDKTGGKQRALFDDRHVSVKAEQRPEHEDALIKSKSRALKIYCNLKKIKEPISPGGRLASFLNSLFAGGNSKKSKNPPSTCGRYDEERKERKSKNGQYLSCSSASSFSRSCLSKYSPSSREKLRNGVKRTVSFYPVSVIVGEDCKPCGQKYLYEEEDLKLHVVEKTRIVGKAAKEFLRDYHQKKKNNDDSFRRDYRQADKVYSDEDDDDAASYSSSDLFELDHLLVAGRGRYTDELPVYETTRVGDSIAIANVLLE